MSQVELTSNPSASIADQLRMEIITGRIEEGAALREVSLAERFEVSRAPIREALKRWLMKAWWSPNPTVECGWHLPHPNPCRNL